MNSDYEEEDVGNPQEPPESMWQPQIQISVEESQRMIAEVNESFKKIRLERERLEQEHQALKVRQESEMQALKAKHQARRELELKAIEDNAAALTDRVLEHAKLRKKIESNMKCIEVEPSTPTSTTSIGSLTAGSPPPTPALGHYAGPAHGRPAHGHHADPAHVHNAVPALEHNAVPAHGAEIADHALGHHAGPAAPAHGHHAGPAPSERQPAKSAATGAVDLAAELENMMGNAVDAHEARMKTKAKAKAAAKKSSRVKAQAKAAAKTSQKKVGLRQ